MSPVLPPRRQTKFLQIFGALHPVRSHDYTHHRRSKTPARFGFPKCTPPAPATVERRSVQSTHLASRRPPPPSAPPPQGLNTWGKPHSTYSTSHTQQAHSDYHYPLPPDHLPDSVQPPPSKKPRTQKNIMPMRPKQPPTKRCRDTEDPPPRKTRSDTYAPKPVAPPQPPGADSSNQRITDFFRAPAPPLPPAEPPPSVSSTPESFSAPSIACPTPPQHLVYSRPNTE